MAFDVLFWSILACVGILVTGAVVAYLTTSVEYLRGHTERHLSGTPEGIISSIGLASPSAVSLDSIPGYVVVALLLHEDDLFFEHHGVNWPEVFVRVKLFLARKDVLRGGSSISQQLAKNVVAREPIRYPILRWIEKLLETVYCLKLERAFSKKELLTLYLSTARFGPVFPVGFTSIVLTLFNKPPEEVTLAETMIVVSLLPRPAARLRKILNIGEATQDMYRTTFEKGVDLYRLYSLTWGWSSLNRLAMISSRDIIERMREFSSYNPWQLPAELEIALEMRAAELVEEVRILHRALSMSQDPEIVKVMRRLGLERGT